LNRAAGHFVKLLSTRARAELWKLQNALREACTVRNESLPRIFQGRKVITQEALHEMWLEFSCADQEYCHAVRQLAAFVEKHASNQDDQSAPNQSTKREAS
jgi:hypothetical protein